MAPTTATPTRSAAPAAAPSAAAPSAAASSAARPARTSRRRRGAEVEAVPLGSLTQRGSAPVEGCATCGSPAVTSLSITLTDGTPARFASCRRCGHRHWADDEGALSITDVLVRTTKP